MDRMCFVYGTQTVALCDYDEARAGESQKSKREHELTPATKY